MQLRNAVVVVTGAGNGIGRQLVVALIARGAKVAGVDISEKGLQATAALVPGPSFAAFPLSITDRQAVQALPARVEAALGPADALINCAGIIQPFVKVAELDFETIERVFDVNWKGTLYMTKAFLPGFLKRPRAHVVNVSSMGGFLPVPGQSAYGASKAAVKLFTEGLWAELQGTPVSVTLVFPGAIGTEIASNSGVTIPGSHDAGAKGGQTTPADEAARQILDAMERDEYRALIGKDAQFLDRFVRLAPKRATAFIASKMQHLLAH
jgi:short-subunit dehydrogenase